MESIRFGIIGTSNITHRFLRGANKLTDVEIVGIASRSMKKAEEYCRTYPRLKAYSSYASLFEDPNIDAVYIATPNYTHFDYVMEALQHGKHVLCEKPMMIHEEQVKNAFIYAKDHHLMLMEAMKPCFLPTTMQAKKWVEEGSIGKLLKIEAKYCSDGLAAFLEGYRSSKECGGGALYDLGVYPLAFVNNVHPHPLLRVRKYIKKLSSGIDVRSSLHLYYDDGVEATITCAIHKKDENLAVITGSQGKIIIKNFWKSEQAILSNQETFRVFIALHNYREFQYQIDAFVQDIRDGNSEDKVMSEASSRRNAHIIDHVLWKKEL